MRIRRLLTLLALLPVLAAACGDDDGADSGAGGDEVDESAELVVYSGRDEDLVAPLIEQFEEASGYDVSVRYGSSAEMGAALLEEGNRSPADVFLTQEVGAIGVLEQAGLLAALPSEIVEQVDARFRPAEGTRWVGVTGRARVIVYNPELVDVAPAGVLELTDPKYRGKVGWAPSNASFQGFITGFRVSHGEDAARAWLEAMQDNGVQEYSNNVEILRAVDAGDLEMGLINHYYWARMFAEVGEEEINAQLVFPKGDDPGGLVNATAAGILGGAADNKAALAFVEYLLSEAGQTYFTEETHEYPVVEGIPNPAGIPALDELEGPAIDLADLESLEATQALLTELGLLS